ncbi:MAG: restriction endonuclease subunit S, partial [Rhodoferax sp.]
PPDTQREIARVLGILDDKIELNRRMSETLEAMARAIFQSWFVDFDPVRAKASGEPIDSICCRLGLTPELLALFPDSFEDSELGEIPKGWDTKYFSEAITINPSRTLKKGVLAPYLDMANMPTASARAHEIVGRAFGSGMKFKNGDTLVARITPCLENGKTCFVDFLEDEQVGWGSTEYIVLRPNLPLPPEYGYFLARTEKFRDHAIANMTGTSGRQRVPASAFNDVRMVIPGVEVAKAFGAFVRGTMESMRSRDAESQTLIAMRDSLLPKLLAGELNRIVEIGQVEVVT